MSRRRRVWRPIGRDREARQGFQAALGESFRAIAAPRYRSPRCSGARFPPPARRVHAGFEGPVQRPS